VASQPTMVMAYLFTFVCIILGPLTENGSNGATHTLNLHEWRLRWLSQSHGIGPGNFPVHSGDRLIAVGISQHSQVGDNQ
jgi:hypothetical protein